MSWEYTYDQPDLDSLHSTHLSNIILMVYDNVDIGIQKLDKSNFYEKKNNIGKFIQAN